MKKKVFCLFSIMLLFICNSVVAQTNNVQGLKGDVNNDGSVDIADVTTLINIILQKQNDNIPAKPIDLGLPSGLKWASYNVGATAPEEYGDYFAWGEIKKKEIYNESTYEFYKNNQFINIGTDISGTEYDVARAKWGEKWRIPRQDEILELINNCRSEWVTCNGINGYRFIGSNGNSIFIPASGYYWDGDLRNDGWGGYIWSSTFYPGKVQSDNDSAYRLMLYKDINMQSGMYSNRIFGQSVRPVTE